MKENEENKKEEIEIENKETKEYTIEETKNDD